MTNLPTPDMSAWSILDFELAFAGVHQINEASLWLQNQPRSYSERARDYHPGAAFIVDIGEQWCGSAMGRLIEELEVRRFPDAEDEDRRLRLLLHYHAGFGPAGEALPELMAMLEGWRAPIPV